VRSTSPSYESAPAQVTAFDAAPPAHSFYAGQTLTAGWNGDGGGATSGFNFIETRDGTTLSAIVRLPGPAANGPYPTIVEYSGYDPSRPDGGGHTNGFAQILNNLGYAYVGVNIRGTGCSGGSFLPFEPVQSLDGYDAIEAVAAQPWVKFHKVGMAGISYPGIEQLYVARTQPPHLSAISPLSVLDDSYRATLWPGGILNTGFAESWASARATNAQPYGEGWEHDVNSTECDANQLVRLQNPDPVALIEGNTFYNKTYYQQIDPSRFVSKITVPVYLAGAWQDEQTGGHFPDFIDRFTSSPHVYATLTNGSHTESLTSMGSFGRWADFLSLYVGRRVPTGIKAFVWTAVASGITGVNGLHLSGQPDYTGLDLTQAKRLYDKGGPIRVIFEEGAAAGAPSGAPVPRFTRTFASWPIPSGTTLRYHLQPHGHLGTSPVTRSATPRSFSADPSALPATDYTGGGNAIWGAHPSYDWRQIPAGKGLGWISAPMTRTRTFIGSGSLDVWVKTKAPDVDLEATVSLVRPNGREVYVQSGWLRASHRALVAHRSTPTLPVHTDLEADARPMPVDRYQKLRIEIFPFAQAFRKGDQLRVTLDAPGGARPLWAFDTLDHGQRVTVANDAQHPSLLALTAVPVSVPSTRPPCSSLRSQPCRDYTP
jgi:predicted acyl esterase